MQNAIIPQPIEGIPISNIMSAFPNNVTGGGKHQMENNISTRLSNLSVPTGYTYIPEDRPHKLQFKSDSSKFTYDIIPEGLYDTLIDLVSVNNGPKKRRTISKTPRPNPQKGTRRK
jgi:hypothetical protein